MKNKILSKWEIFLIFPLVVLFVFNNYLNNMQGISTITMYLIIFLLVIGLLYDIRHVQSISQLFYFLFLFFILIIWKYNRTTISIVALAFVFMMISPEKTIYMYSWIMGLQTIGGALLSLIGLAPFINTRTGVLTLGFANENGLGAALEILAISLIFEVKKGKLILSKSYYRWGFLIFVVLFDLIIINDNTAVLTILILLIILLLKKVIIRSALVKVMVSVLPLAISSFAIWIGIHYNSTISWMYKLNEAVTQRIFIWNYYFNNYPIQWMPSNWIYNKQIYWGFFDGAYAYFVIDKGILLTVILILGLIICNVRLIISKKWNLLSIMIALEIAGFSENIVITYYLSFALIFIISAYNPLWLKNYKIKGDSIANNDFKNY
ncbi:hypothetical protein ACQQ90_06470 [Limosilactobacillus reuteri]|uniref:hypothetical protein n=1 Tax=Limosilactobacillus reuteri TaxID=1598 RepID=UPI003D08F7EF